MAGLIRVTVPLLSIIILKKCTRLSSTSMLTCLVVCSFTKSISILNVVLHLYYIYRVAGWFFLFWTFYEQLVVPLLSFSFDMWLIFERTNETNFDCPKTSNTRRLNAENHWVLSKNYQSSS